MIAAGADTLSRAKPFVCHSTPHFDSTSRKVSYSVLPYHTRTDRKSKVLFYRDFERSWTSSKSEMMELLIKKPRAVKCQRPS